MQVRSLGQEDPPEKEMATYSSILAWRIPWTEEPGGLQSMELPETQIRAAEHTHVNLTQHLSPPQAPTTGGRASEPFPGPAQSRRPSVLQGVWVGAAFQKQDMRFLRNSARAARHRASFLVVEEGWMP